MKTVKSCCCGCSLRTGTLLIGLVEMVFLVVSFGMSVDGIIKSSAAVVLMGQINKVMASIISGIFVVVFLLILGSYKEKLWMMIPWIGSHMTNIICFPPLFIYFVVEFSSIPILCVGIIIGLLISTAVNGYFLLVVFSHFEEIREKQAKTENNFQMSHPHQGRLP